jgi:Fe-S cluster assembly protein SufD
MTSATLHLTDLQEAVERLPGDALSASRRAALAHLRKHGLPTTRDEDWKYTDLAPVIDISNRSLQQDSVTASSDGLDDVIDTICRSVDAEWLVVRNGVIDRESVVRLDQAGVSVTLLSESGGAMEFNAPLSNLNAALLQDGLRVRVADGEKMGRPIGFLLVDSAAETPGMTQARVEIDVGANSTASFVEYHASIGAAEHYANHIAELALGENSHVDFVRIQERGRNHNQTSRLAVVTGRDSEFHHCGFDIGGRLVRNDLHIDISQPGSSVEFNGLYLAGDRQHIDNHTRTDHRVGPARSTQEYRGIVTGRARCVWNGKAIVHQGADGTDAAQANHNLLLSERAEVDAKPELEIYADDVKCSHGTTIGELDETALYYLRTRGLSKHDAEQLLTRAFAQAIVGKAPIAAMHEMLEEKIAQHLGPLLEGIDA